MAKSFLLEDDDSSFGVSQDMEKVLSFFSQKLSDLYIDLINIEIIKKLRCVVGSKTFSIESLAAVFIKDKKTAVIEVFDKSLCFSVIKSLQSLKLSVKQDDNKIFVFCAPLTGEKRILLEKEIKKLSEHTKVLIRQIRQIFINKYKNMLKKKLISEDDFLKNEKSIQNLTDSFIKKIEMLVVKKLESIVRN